MRILHVMGGNEEGGLEKHVIELVNTLAEYPDDQVMLAAHAKYQPRVSAQVTFIPVDLSRSRRSPLALWALWRSVRQHKPDVIHAQGGKAMAMIATLASRLHRPLVATVHGQKKKQPGLAAFSAIIAVSAGLARQINHPSVHVIYNGIAPPLEHDKQQIADLRQSLQPVSGQRLWLAVGRLVHVKGFDILLEAMTKVPTGHLLIAGEGPEADRLKALCRDLKLQQRVSFLGNRSDVSALMSACDAVVISSRREGFSYVFCEAAMQATPVISTDVPIPNEMLPSSLICPTDNPDALALLMNTFNPDDPGHGDSHRAAREKLTIAAMAGATRDLYNGITPTDRRAS
ncbi:glycosyltransferase [Marinobacter sp. BGYM27]|uniref:glycosyltransferase n=1 Tax=unclassified Marinobacter TaxID=83889 RepID=UPI0021A35CCB|nr:glycosyltransferase [Marinobacter sp. BGYM27]MDG5501338.1 glycosyltransferase [Marinobacter sp. BGYM27]